MKRDGSADQSTKSKAMEKIEKFFNDEYINIVETQLNAKEGDDFLTDETLKECIKVEIQQYITIYSCIRDVVAISMVTC